MGLYLLDTCAAVDMAYCPSLKFNTRLPKISPLHTVGLTKIVIDELSQWHKNDRHHFSPQVHILENATISDFKPNEADLAKAENHLERYLKEEGLSLQKGESKLIALSLALGCQFVTADNAAFQVANNLDCRVIRSGECVADLVNAKILSSADASRLVAAWRSARRRHLTTSCRTALLREGVQLPQR